MKKLFLSSSFKDVASLLPDFTGDFTGKTITFIPTASVVEKVSFFVNSGKKALEKMGLIVDVLEVSTASSEEIAQKLRQNDFIYITGGNTFFLLQELRKSGADKIISEQIALGKIYIGESAGAMVVAPNIEFAKAMDSTKKAPELTDFDGLGIVDFYPVPHYTNAPFKKAVEKIIDSYGESLALKPISNKQAILFENGEARIESV
jgi:Peptidase E